MEILMLMLVVFVVMIWFTALDIQADLSALRELFEDDEEDETSLTTLE